MRLLHLLLIIEHLLLVSGFSERPPGIGSHTAVGGPRHDSQRAAGSAISGHGTASERVQRL